MDVSRSWYRFLSIVVIASMSFLMTCTGTQRRNPATSVSPQSQVAQPVVSGKVPPAQGYVALPPEGYKLGATYDSGARRVVFRFWDPFARSVSVLLYRDRLAIKSDFRLGMARNPATGVWSGVFEEADPAGLFYEYRIDSGGGEASFLDPYAQCTAGSSGKGVVRGVVIDTARTLPADGWAAFTDYGPVRREDAIVYRIAVRDFTIAPEAGTKSRPGTFHAFIEKLPSITALGVTHVQIDALSFSTLETSAIADHSGAAAGTKPESLPMRTSVFSPDASLSSDPQDPHALVQELKTLVREIHRAGMGVIFELNPGDLSRIGVPDPPGAPGVSQDRKSVADAQAALRIMAGRLLRDALVHFAGEYHVDGFALRSTENLGFAAVLAARDAVATLPGKEDILIVVDGYGVLDKDALLQTDSLAILDDGLRGFLSGSNPGGGSGFVTGAPVDTQRLYDILSGRSIIHRTDAPGDSMWYVSGSGSPPLADGIARSLGLSLAVPQDRAQVIARTKLVYFLALTGQSALLLNGGCERGRSGQAHTDAPDTPEAGGFPWALSPDLAALAGWVGGMIGVRRSQPGFRLGNAALVASSMQKIPTDSPQAFGWTIASAGRLLVMLVNAHPESAAGFDTGRNLSSARVLVDSGGASKDGLARLTGLKLQDSKATLAPLSVALLELPIP